jgi:uncharacterized membrane protein
VTSQPNEKIRINKSEANAGKLLKAYGKAVVREKIQVSNTHTHIHDQAHWQVRKCKLQTTMQYRVFTSQVNKWLKNLILSNVSKRIER